MAKINKNATSPFKSKTATTYEGAVAAIYSPEKQLKRLTAAHLLWEDTFYVDGQTAAELVQAVAHQVSPQALAETAIETREVMKLRHMPLLLVRELSRHPARGLAPSLVSNTLARVIQRPDELTEFLAIYWKGGKQPLSAQVKKGLAKAFTKFDAYQFAKYDRDSDIKLRDVLFMVHAKPGVKQSDRLFNQIATRTLPTPDTWETRLSSGGEKKSDLDKRVQWTEMLEGNKLGAMALLRNLRNMQEVDVDRHVIRKALRKASAEKVLPYRFIAAARYAPDFEPELEELMFSSLAQFDRLSGRTAILIDVSGSMDSQLSEKSEMTRKDAAIGLAIMLRELSDDVDIYVFGDTAAKVAPRRGFALRDAIARSNVGYSTNGWAGLGLANRAGYDRILCVTDEQWHSSAYWGSYRNDNVATAAYPIIRKPAYMVNVAAYQHGVAYGDHWEVISGWSEGVVRYIEAVEKES